MPYSDASGSFLIENGPRQESCTCGHFMLPIHLPVTNCRRASTNLLTALWFRARPSCCVQVTIFFIIGNRTEEASNASCRTSAFGVLPPSNPRGGADP